MQYFPKKSATDIFTGVLWDNSRPSIGMFEKDMAASLTDIFKTETPKNFDEFCRFECRHLRHTKTGRSVDISVIPINRGTSVAEKSMDSR